MIKNFIKEHSLEYYEEANLKRYNTYRLETICKYLIFPKNKFFSVEFTVIKNCL